MKLGEAVLPVWRDWLRVHKQVVDAVEARLKAAGLPPLGWYDVLIELRGCRSGLRQYEIGERMLLSKHNLSRLLDRLEHQGLVRRNTCPEDARGSVVSFTEAGQKLLRRMWPVYEAAIDEHFARRLNQRELASLSALNRKLSG